MDADSAWDGFTHSTGDVSMSAGHRHASNAPMSAARSRELQALLEHPEFQEAVQGYDRVDGTRDVPFVGGSGIDWRTIYWDRQFVGAVNANRFIVAGRPFNPLPIGKVHESVEGAILHLWELVRQILGWPESGRRYDRAHDVADVAERHALGHIHPEIPWSAYQDSWEPFIRLDGREKITNPPPGLLLDPYQGDRKMMTTLMRGGGRTSEQMQGKPTMMLTKDVGDHEYR